MKKELNYHFRKRLLQVHEKDVRDFSVLPLSDELEIKDSVAIYLAKDADEVVLTAAKDFLDYLFTSMQISAMLKYGTPVACENAIVLSLAEDSGLDLGDANGCRGFRIDVSDNTVCINGFDSRGISQALFYLEDMMSLRHAPYLPKGIVARKPLYSPQMVHSGYQLDCYPDAYLAQIAHEGRDAILVFTTDVDRTPSGYLDFNELIYRAGKYGIDVYAYSYLKSEMHPDEDGAEAYYENSYGRLFQNCPGLKGVTLVGESVEFPSKDPHVTGKSYRDNVVDGIPTGKTSPGWYPCEDFPQWLTLIKKVINRHKLDADIVFWTYNWGYQPEEARVKLLKALPDGISVQATFEMFEKFKLEGNVEYCADYTLSSAGYGKYFASEAKIAKEKGIRLYSMTNTGGLTWDFGVIPYEPFPYQWMKRYRAMKQAHDDWGLCGIMEGHHYGFYPSVISKFSKLAFYGSADNLEGLLEQIVIGTYGAEAAPNVLSTFELWSEAITHYIPTDADQYGAFRVGPSYPFCLDRVVNLIARPYSMFGSDICAPVYNAHCAGIAGDEARGALASVRVPAEIRSLEKMRDLISAGIGELEKVQDKNEKLQRLLNLGKFILCTVVTGIHAKQWHQLKCRLQCEEDTRVISEILDSMERLLDAEAENAESAIPLVQMDSRLGWEPSMEYMTDEAQIRWKLRQLEFVRNTELFAYRKSLPLCAQK